MAREKVPWQWAAIPVVGAVFAVFFAVRAWRGDDQLDTTLTLVFAMLTVLSAVYVAHRVKKSGE